MEITNKDNKGQYYVTIDVKTECTIPVEALNDKKADEIAIDRFKASNDWEEFSPIIRDINVVHVEDALKNQYPR